MTEAFERVLQLVAQGKLSADEAAPILEALERKPKGAPGHPARHPRRRRRRRRSSERTSARRPARPATPARFARIEVRERGRRVVDLRIPISLGRFALSRVPGLSTQQIAEVEDAVTSGAHGPILDVQDPDGDGVRIVLE